MKRIALGVCVTASLGLGAVALADGTGGSLRAPAGLGAPTGLSVPGGLNVIGAGVGDCAVPDCAAGDAACEQIAFEAAITCLQLGALTTCDDCLPAPDTTFFTARGPGVTLIGAVGTGGQRRALLGLREAVQSRR